MAALTEDRDTLQRDGNEYSFPVLAGAKIFAGSMVVLNADGWARPAITGTGLISVGRASTCVDNTNGANGAVSVTVQKGVFLFNNSTSTDAITLAQVGSLCYLVDDNVVAKTAATNTRSAAGIVRDVEAAGVWVEFT